MGYNPWGHRESDMTEHTYTHTHTHTMQGICLPILPQGPAVTHDSRSSALGQNLTMSFTQAQNSGWASKSMVVISSPSIFEP